MYIPGAGWIGLDPTSGLFAGEGHIPLSATPHPESAAPITGATEPCETTLDFSNVVTRVHEDPRVTLPYTEAAWAPICALGARVDERLAAGDVRLTVGGEPTFVSIDNQVDPEWTTDADGPHKRERASALAARLKKVWAPQGLVQRSQGKWYPGEPLPRWQIGLHWRTDGEPLWTDDALLADPWPSEPQTLERRRRRRTAGARRHRRRPRPAGRPRCGRPTRTRWAGWPRRSGNPRANPSRPKTISRPTPPTARAALLARLDESVTEPAAYVLPLHRRDDDSGWASADWRLRRGRIVLLEGDSPAGLRLPLDSISWRPPRPRSRPIRWPRRDAAAGRPRRPATAVVEDADGAPTTAMVAEVRDGLLYVFLPPTEELEHFVDLIAPGRGRRREGRLPGRHRGLRPAARPAAAVDDRHPRPRRHRGQRRAHRQLRRTARSSWKPSTSRPGWPGCPPSRSTSTAPTAAPAAATTSRWAASPRPIRRCCAGPTCWCRC